MAFNRITLLLLLPHLTSPFFITDPIQLNSFISLPSPILSRDSPTPENNHKNRFRIRLQGKPDRLLGDFKIYSGEIVDPYKTLKIDRKADREEIKNAYWNLSKRYHPDMTRQVEILPGNCNDLDEARDEWERIKLSYEILTDKKKRVRYDRNIALSDPSAAMGRAALDLFGWGLKGVGKGVVEVGKGVVKVGGAVVNELGKDREANHKAGDGNEMNMEDFITHTDELYGEIKELPIASIDDGPPTFELHRQQIKMPKELSYLEQLELMSRLSQDKNGAQRH